MHHCLIKCKFPLPYVYIVLVVYSSAPQKTAVKNDERCLNIAHSSIFFQRHDDLFLWMFLCVLDRVQG